MLVATESIWGQADCDLQVYEAASKGEADDMALGKLKSFLEVYTCLVSTSAYLAKYRCKVM